MILLSSLTGPPSISTGHTLGNLFIYGDSIAAGDGGGGGPTGSWPGRVKAIYPSTTVLATGGRKLNDDWPDHTTGLAFIAASIAPYSPDSLWDEIGINDYLDHPIGDEHAFAAQKADFWDSLHAAFPSMLIYAQTNLYTNHDLYYGQSSQETWRQVSIRDVAATRPFVQVVEWGGLITAADTGDGLHPTETTNETILFPAARAVLGL